MRAGQLDQLVTFQRRVVTQDAFGQDTVTWVDIETVWAQCHALRGKEFFAAAQTQMEQSIKMRIRYRSDIDVSCRAVWEGRNHDITGVIPVGRYDMLEVMCLQGVKDGR